MKRHKKVENSGKDECRTNFFKLSMPFKVLNEKGKENL